MVQGLGFIGFTRAHPVIETHNLSGRVNLTNCRRQWYQRYQNVPSIASVIWCSHGDDEGWSWCSRLFLLLLLDYYYELYVMLMIISVLIIIHDYDLLVLIMCPLGCSSTNFWLVKSEHVSLSRSPPVYVSVCVYIYIHICMAIHVSA